jgi:hypothetical protein
MMAPNRYKMACYSDAGFQLINLKSAEVFPNLCTVKV